jgi:Resolvase, N terminal domain
VNEDRKYGHHDALELPSGKVVLLTRCLVGQRAKVLQLPVAEREADPIYGYARVRTDGQTLAAQDAQLHAAGRAKVYSEKVSGAQTDRVDATTIGRLDCLPAQ